MRYEISAEDLVRLMLLASHLDTDDEIGGILMRVSKSAMENQKPDVPREPHGTFPLAKPE